MRLVADVKLKATEKQRSALLETLERANDAANWLSGEALRLQKFCQYDLHHLAYYELRDRFQLSAQMAIRVISKVADAYKEPEPYGATCALGVDLGVKNIACDSKGETFSADRIDAARRRYDRLKRQLQRRATKSAKRHLKKISGREARFRRNTNHVIAKKLVAKAQRHRASIALEDLKGIRSRTTVRKRQRRRHHSWAFHQLRQFVSYKAALAGVPVEIVDARGTSRTCSSCGHEARANRKTRDDFVCKACGYAVPADHNAAVNIAVRAEVKRPIVATDVCVVSHGHRELAASPRL